jgi:hypothetical protein
MTGPRLPNEVDNGPLERDSCHGRPSSKNGVSGSIRCLRTVSLPGQSFDSSHDGRTPSRRHTIRRPWYDRTSLAGLRTEVRIVSEAWCKHDDYASVEQFARSLPLADLASTPRIVYGRRPPCETPRSGPVRGFPSAIPGRSAPHHDLRSAGPPARCRFRSNSSRLRDVAIPQRRPMYRRSDSVGSRRSHRRTVLIHRRPAVLVATELYR